MAKRDAGEGSVYRKTKRRKRKDGSIRETEVWEGYVTLKTTVIDGKRKQDRAYVQRATKTAAVKAVRDLANKRDSGILQPGRTPTVEEWAEHYLTVIAPTKRIKQQIGVRGTTLASQRSHVKNWITPHLGRRRLDRLTKADVEAMYQAAADKGLATTMLERIHSTLHAILESAIADDRIQRNVSHHARIPLGAPSRVKRQSLPDEPRRVLDAALKLRCPPRWIARLCYGLRQGESLGMRWPDVDLDAGVLWVSWQVQRERNAQHGCGEPQTEVIQPRDRKVRHGCGEPSGETSEGRGTGPGRTKRELRVARPSYPCGYVHPGRCPQKIEPEDAHEEQVWPCGKRQPARCPEGTGGGLQLLRLKTRASQAPLPVPLPIGELFRTWRREQQKERLVMGSGWVGWEVPTLSRPGERVQADLVVAQPNGRPIEGRRDWDEWYALLKRAGVDPIEPHAARGWAATMLAELEVQPIVAMEMLRHAQVVTTLQIYMRAPSPALRSAAEQIAARMGLNLGAAG